MTKKKGYQLFDVANNKRGERFVQDINDFINRDWYGYQRRGRLPKPGVPLNWQGQSRVLDSSRWAIYVRGVPAPRKFIEHSKLQQARTSYKYFRELYDKACISNEELRNKYDALAVKIIKEYKISLFGWNISLWRDDKDDKPS